MDILLKIWKTLEERLCCIQGSLDRMDSGAGSATTATLVRQTTGTADYANPALVSVAIASLYDTVIVNSVTVDPGITLEYTAEPGALLSGAFSVNCGSSAGVAIVARTLRS